MALEGQRVSQQREPAAAPQPTAHPPATAASVVPERLALQDALGNAGTSRYLRGLQFKEKEGGSGLAPSDPRAAAVVGEIASAGFSGHARALPHLPRIQESFGRHDISAVDAHVGSEAAVASDQLGARAYAHGERVAFGGAPDLHTAAHEAAHVVQQRQGGVQLRGAVGERGDRYERQADAVADRVVAGASAEALLGAPVEAGAGASNSGVVVQRQPRDPTPPPDAPAPQAAPDVDASADDDIDWVGGLDAALVDDIDGKYSDAKARRAAATAIDAETRARQRAIKAGSTTDAAWQRKQLEAEGKRRKEEAAENRDQTVAWKTPKETAVQPSEATLTRGERQRIRRVNFVKMTKDLLGSSEKAKAHYGAIKPVSGIGILLTTDAGARLLAAKREFESEHEGFTFSPGDGFSMRSLQEARNGVGMLGHALGVAFDIRATQNPNIKLPEGTKLGSYRYLIAHAGAAKGKLGRATMDLNAGGAFGSSDKAIAELGEKTAAGKDTHNDPMAKAIREQFDEMVATSIRLKASMEKSLLLLKAARTRYFDLLKDKAKLAAGKEQLKKDMATAFQPWLAFIQKDLDADTAELPLVQLRLDAIDVALKDLGKINVRSADALADLDKLAARLNLSQDAGAARERARGPGAFKTFLLARARAQRNAIPSGPKTKGSKEYLAAEIEVLHRWHDLLLDPALVFGSPTRQVGVSEIPVMQLIEHGFIEESTTMGPIQKGQQRKELFSAEVTVTLARHGFAPGATFGDTMHFDFVAGYNQAVPGGRSLENMNPDRYGPLGIRGAAKTGNP
jgi:hypothetical protein